MSRVHEKLLTFLFKYTNIDYLNLLDKIIKMCYTISSKFSYERTLIIVSGNYKAPIVHGVGFTGEIPTKCNNCKHKVSEDGHRVCAKNEQGKFNCGIAFRGFEYKK